jgi:hypothetical protein
MNLPLLAGSTPGFARIVQVVWAHHRPRFKLVLVLVLTGSAVGVMEEIMGTGEALRARPTPAGAGGPDRSRGFPAISVVGLLQLCIVWWLPAASAAVGCQRLDPREPAPICVREARCCSWARRAAARATYRTRTDTCVSGSQVLGSEAALIVGGRGDAALDRALSRWHAPQIHVQGAVQRPLLAARAFLANCRRA